MPALAAAIRRAVSDPTVSDAARRLGENVRAENGAEAAVDLLEQEVLGRR
ncbi:hypothetical protein ACFY36_20330 [Actinoplanes sp. NPDC000266]